MPIIPKTQLDKDPAKEVKLDKNFRVFIRNDTEKTVVGFEEFDENGDPIMSVDNLIDYGDSVTYTWVIGKYYEHNDAETCFDKYEKKELNTNE